jgi:spore coat polysaccharide biosynthesis protein SpsF
MQYVDAIIQARLGSNRLKEKPLRRLNGKPLLQHVFDRVSQSSYINRVIIATTLDSSDDKLVEYCKRNNMPVYRGDTDNVLGRIISTCQEYGCEKIVRVCGDNPFIDIQSMDELLSKFTENDAIAYCTYVTDTMVPIILKPIGLFVEAVTVEALKTIERTTKDPKYLENVTMYIYEHPEKFRVEQLKLNPNINPEYRFTIDYEEDLSHCELVIRRTRSQTAQSLMMLMAQDKGLREKIMTFSKGHPKEYR